LSIAEFKAVKKMLPIFEVKQAYTPQVNSHFLNYIDQGGNLSNFVILGKSTNSGSAGTTYGPDFMDTGVTDGARIGNRISIRKLTLDVHINLDGTFTDSNARPGPYLFRWWVYRVKGTLNAGSEGGLVANNTDWKQWFDLGNDTYAAPDGTQRDMYNRVNRNVYTVYREGTFVLQTDKQKTDTGGGNSTNLTQPMMQSDSKLYKHIHLDLTKHCAKVLKYQDDIAGVLGCTNDSMFFCCNFIRYDGENFSEQVQANVTFMPHLLYTDA